MSELSGNVVVFGAVSRDVFAEAGDVSPEYQPGEKIAWIPGRHDERLKQLLDNGAEWHLGGNGMNVAARLAVESSLEGRVNFVSVLGTDETSDLARAHMDVMGINDQTLTVENYHPSVGIIESEEGGDRMIISRQRGPMEQHLSAEHITETTIGADLVVATSLKDAGLTKQVFENTPSDSFLSYNPGSTELRSHMQAIRQLLEERNPNLLAVNEEELRRIVGASDRVNRYDLARNATAYAENVLCTLGGAGIILARRLNLGSEHTFYPIKPLPSEQVTNTIGAGDRAHALAALGLAQDAKDLDVLAAIEYEAAQVIQKRGAHADVYGLRYPEHATQ